MSNHITIIDKVVGTNKYGFCIRVGLETSQQRLASCIGINKHAGGLRSGFDVSVYSSFKEAQDAAIEFRNRVHPTWSVRADCTLT